MEVPPPCDSLMAKGGEGEVKNPAGGARGGGGVRGDEIFLPRSQGDGIFSKKDFNWKL